MQNRCNRKFDRDRFHRLNAAASSITKTILSFLFALAFFQILFLLFSPYPPGSWQHGLTHLVAFPAAFYVTWKSLKQDKAARQQPR